jgi:MFS family permease
MNHNHKNKDSNKQVNNIRAWLVLVSVYLASITVTMSMMKVPPLMNLLIKDLNTDTTTGGLFMSSFMIAGVILAIPVASLLNSWGPKKSGLIALGFTIFGSLFGSLAQGSAMILLIGRFIEGIGFAGIMVIAPAVVSMWFEPESRGLPMGIWATWVPVGMFIIFNLAKPLESFFGWRGVWWFNAIFALIVSFIYHRVIDYPIKREEIKDEKERKENSHLKLSKGLYNLNTWLLAIVFLIFGISIQGYVNWLPTFLIDSGIDTSLANFFVSMISVGRIPAIVIAGLIINYAKRQKNILALSLIMSVVIFSLWFRVNSISSLTVWMIILGLSSGFCPTSIFTMATNTVYRTEFIGIALALVNIGFNLGQMMGPPLIGMIISKGSWVPVKYFVIIPLIIGVILVFNINEPGKQAISLDQS